MAIWRATLNFLFSVDSAHPTATDLESVANLVNTSATVGDGSALQLSTNEGDGSGGLARAKVFAKRAGTGGAGEMSLSTRTAAGNMTEAVNISTTQAVLCTSPTGGLGYGAGAGGTVTQATNKSTGVTLSRVSGQITMNGEALAAGTAVSFTLTNTAIAATDHLLMSSAATGTVGAYYFEARCAAGSALITVRNLTAGSLSEAVVIGFVVVKGVIT